MEPDDVWDSLTVGSRWGGGELAFPHVENIIPPLPHLYIYVTVARLSSDGTRIKVMFFFSFSSPFWKENPPPPPPIPILFFIYILFSRRGFFFLNVAWEI